jgi:hypothetical protein
MQQHTMTDLGEVKKYLGVKFNQVSQGLLPHKHYYLESIFKEFKMTDCWPKVFPIDADVFLVENT